MPSRQPLQTNSNSNLHSANTQIPTSVRPFAPETQVDIKTASTELEQNNSTSEEKSRAFHSLSNIGVGTAARTTLQRSESQKEQKTQFKSLADSRQPLANTNWQALGKNAFGVGSNNTRKFTLHKTNQLNHSIQAKASTVGYDLFFQQKEHQQSHGDSQNFLEHNPTRVSPKNQYSAARMNSNTGNGGIQRQHYPYNKAISQRTTDTTSGMSFPSSFEHQLAHGLNNQFNIASTTQEFSIQCAGNSGEFQTQGSLDSHFEKHVTNQSDAGGNYASSDAYEKAAMGIVASHDENKKSGKNTYYWKDSTSQIVVVRDGFIRSMFVPSSGKKYYDKQ